MLSKDVSALSRNPTPEGEEQNRGVFLRFRRLVAAGDTVWAMTFEAPADGDAFGAALLSHLEHGDDGLHMIERDDGFVEVASASVYFGDIDAWSATELRAIEMVSGRVLDVGAGAGRATLYLQERGIDARGPFPADSIFVRASRGEFDGVVAMYHDQGHIPIKVYGFEESVAVTLGLPIVRTSVDHGTAFDIAWQGLASEESLVEAIRLAARLAS